MFQLLQLKDNFLIFLERTIGIEIMVIDLLQNRSIDA